MKKIIKSLVFSSITICLMFVSVSVLADPPGPPADHGVSGNQDPGPVGAPIDGGLGILILLAGSAGYGGLKLYNEKKKEKAGKELQG